MNINEKYFTYADYMYSDTTKESYVRYIKSFIGYVNKPENEITPFDIMEWLNLKEESTATKHLKLEAVKSYFKFLKKFKIVDEDPTAEVETPEVKNKPKHYMDRNMIQSMINACQNNRDKAIVMTYATTGMRVSELTSVTLNQYKSMRENGGNKIRITGKGNKDRYVEFNPQVCEAIDKYLRTWNNGRNCDKLFLSMYGNAIARNNLNTSLKSIAKRAGIPFWNEISNHALRSACASIYSEEGLPVANIRDMLGHSSIDVTNRYIKTGGMVTSEAVNHMTFNI